LLIRLNLFCFNYIKFILIFVLITLNLFWYGQRLTWFELGLSWLNLNTDQLGSTLVWSGQLDISSSLDNSTSTRVRTTWHQPEPDDLSSVRAQAPQLDIGTGLGPATRHRLGSEPARLVIGLGPLHSTFAHAHLARHWPGPIDSTSIRVRSTRHWSEPGRLDIGPGLGDSTLAQARSARHQPGPARFDIDSGLLSSTMVRARSAWHRLDCLGLTWIGPSQNPTQNAIWIIQKCIKSISNPYLIKWIEFKILWIWIYLDFFFLLSRIGFAAIA